MGDVRPSGRRRKVRYHYSFRSRTLLGDWLVEACPFRDAHARSVKDRRNPDTRPVRVRGSLTGFCRFCSAFVRARVPRYSSYFVCDDALCVCVRRWRRRGSRVSSTLALSQLRSNAYVWFWFLTGFEHNGCKMLPLRTDSGGEFDWGGTSVRR